MKLYYKPGACSLASHIILNEVGERFALESVDTASRRTASGADYLRINPKGKVPALELEGEVLTEGPAILQFIADRKGRRDLAPEPGGMARARLLEVLNFTGTELHVAFGPLFNPASDEASKAAARKAVSAKLDWLESRLGDGRSYLTGSDFTVADAYAFVVANWANFTGIDLSAWPKLSGFMQRVAERPSVQASLRAEGLA
ncbi:glutathione transferase GstA [Gellertiella hungarica]|uniref:Glutathione S-transferase n=1 Tax=Gellertiella hungarica TaxID=1572859 RepID=A0A7W6J864_9HYPH|nr:glutathione transferase GstA [Gellertiella hungarica]MBB4066571.1 glutathione S-transferase [Gellertiella hungarica]